MKRLLARQLPMKHWMNNFVQELVWVLALAGTDGAIKKYMAGHLKEGKAKPVLGGRVILKKLNNPGAMLGFGKKHPKLLNTAVGIMLILILLRLSAEDKTEGNRLMKAGLTLLAGGGLGNLTDRICQDYVEDYLNIPCRSKKLSSLVFNLADLYILAGTILLAAGECT